MFPDWAGAFPGWPVRASEPGQSAGLAAGERPSTTRQTAINNCIVSLKANGLFDTQFDVLVVTRGSGVNSTKLNWIKDSSNALGVPNGKEYFVFEIVEFCTDLNILEREQYWIDFYDSYINGYNCTPIAGNCQGRLVSHKTKLKISNSLRGKKMPRTKEHDIKLSMAKMKRVIQYDLTGVFLNEFSSANEAANKSNLSQSVISLSCNGKRKCKTFIFKYKDNE